MIITQRQCALFSLFRPPMTCHPLWNRRRNRLVKIGDYKGNSGSGKQLLPKCCNMNWDTTSWWFLKTSSVEKCYASKTGQTQKRCPCCQNCLCMEKIIAKQLFLRAYCNSKWYMPLFELAKNTFKDEIRDYYCGLTFTETLIKHGTKSNKDDFGEEEMKKRRHKKDYIKIIPEKTFCKT